FLFKSNPLYHTLSNEPLELNLFSSPPKILAALTHAQDLDRLSLSSNIKRVTGNVQSAERRSHD
ncbi:hypothetical protein ACFL5Z_20650, partial [Planctomycetota bacterium]